MISDTCLNIIETTSPINARIDSLLMVQDSKMDTVLSDLTSIMVDGTDYSPEIQVFAIPLIIAIFTIMGPLIFTIITRIDSKYSAKEFINLYWNHCVFKTFKSCSIICFVTIAAYAIFRKYTSPIGWSVSLSLFAILLFGSAVLVFIRALRFNNPLKLLSEVFSKYNGGVCDNPKEFYSLCTHLVHYAIVHDITLLHEFVNKFANEHLQQLPEYNEELYSAIIDIAADYKETEEDAEVNDALAFLFAALVDATPIGYTHQDTYNALFKVMYISNRNKHYSLINVFQRRMRYAYYQIAEDATNNKNERANRLQYFVLTLNGLLYGKGTMECVNDAINNNYDVVIIGDATIIPSTSNQALDLFLFMREVLMDGKEFAYYCYIVSDLTSYSNVTLLNRYMSGYFAFLIKKLHQSKLMPEDLLLSAYIRDNNVKLSFDALIKHAPDSDTKNHIVNLKESYWKCRHEIIVNTSINRTLCEHVLAEQINVKQILTTLFNGIATSNPIYMQDAESIIHPIFEKSGIPRVSLLDASIATECNFYEKYDFGSRAVECIMDALADVYNSFNRIEENIRRRDINKRWLDLVCEYDYSFLSFHVNVPNKRIPFGKKFSGYFPPKSIIAIRIPDLPYVEWTKDCQLLSIEDNKMDENVAPTVNIKVDLHINIHYKKNTNIYILKVIEE